MAKFSELVNSEKAANDADDQARIALSDADAAKSAAHQAVIDGLNKVGGKAAVLSVDTVDVYTLNSPTSYTVESIPEDPEV